MSIISKLANPEQRKWLDGYEKATGFEALYQEDFDNGEITFRELTAKNILWFELWFGDAMNAIPAYSEVVA